MDLSDLIKAIKESGKKTNSYDTTATVRRIQGNIAWVHIPGGVDETPVKMTVKAKAGDTVQVRVGGGKAWITGNETAPPTDDTTAVHVAKNLQIVEKVVGKVKGVAESAAKIAGNTNQYFWVTKTGEDTGAHITEVPQDEFLSDPENGGGNLLARSNGIAIRDGLRELAVFAKDLLQFKNGDEVTTAEIASTSVKYSIRDSAGAANQTPSIRPRQYEALPIATFSKTAKTVIADTQNPIEYNVNVSDIWLYTANAQGMNGVYINDEEAGSQEIKMVGQTSSLPATITKQIDFSYYDGSVHAAGYGTLTLNIKHESKNIIASMSLDIQNLNTSYGDVTRYNPGLFKTIISYTVGDLYAPTYLFGTKRAGNTKKKYELLAGEMLQSGCANQAVFGKYNEEDSDAALVIGNGTSDLNRSNVFKVNWDGTAETSAGDLVPQTATTWLQPTLGSTPVITPDTNYPGGYYVEGKRCYVQMRFSLISGLNANSALVVASNMPVPYNTPDAVLNVLVYNRGGHACRVNSDGELQIIADVDHAITAGRSIDVTGVYTIA